MSMDPPSASNIASANYNSNTNTTIGAATGERQPRRRGGRGKGRRGSGPDATSERVENNRIAEETDDQPAEQGNQKPRERRRARGGRGKSGVQKATEQQPSKPETPSSPRTEQALEFIAESLQSIDTSNVDNNTQRQRGKKSRQRQIKGKESNAQDVQKQANDASGSNPTQTDVPTDNAKKKRRSRPNRKSRNKLKRPWLSSIPPGTVDPISLDPLEDLLYPPFALVMDEPYVAIYPGMWPPPALKESEKKQANKSDLEKDREVSILKEQWGDGVVHADEKKSDDTRSKTDSKSVATNELTNLQGRQFYLFDGFVLAGYLTRTLQFINPYNRRDLTRPELEALDAYMAVHKLGNAQVCQAYDKKGVTLSSAGVAGQTAAGRAEIRQQEARAIRNTFFRSGAGSTGTLDQLGANQRHRRLQQNSSGREQLEEITNELQQMYQYQRDNLSGNHSVAPGQQSTDTGVYGEDDGGLVMIDDDINPGLRSGVPNISGSLYSARQIAEQHSQQAQVRQENFPSLSATASATTTIASNNTVPKSQTAPSKSLKSITKVVKKTDPADIARQKKAREEAQRKAELSRLSFFDPSSTPSSNTNNGLLTAPILTGKMVATDAMLERNRNVASALGVLPTQMRNVPQLTGWARPTSADIQLDQFGNEINATQYPETLLAQAKDRMTELVKLERIWKKFLADDKEASCSLKPMDRTTRVFVHEYSDFWCLKTQSYDPEGRRYIHCSKLVDTTVPHPLLSDAAKKWRGPVPGAPPAPHRAPISSSTAPPSSTAAITSTNDSESWHTEQRVRLKLAPRTLAAGAPQPDTIGMGMTRSTSTPLLSMTGEKPTPQRFAYLHEERPKLQLAPRTIPPSEESQKIANEAEMALKKEQARKHRNEKREKKQRDREEKKKAFLESAFASDVESDGESSESDWFEGDAAFDESDDEGL